MDDIGIALRMEQVSKRYPGTLAVDRVDFEARSGEVHAVIGENGAGKSTLMNMIAGAFPDYTGRILIGSLEVALHSPTAAKRCGIQMIHQELSLAQPLSVAENLMAGRLPVRRGRLDRRTLLSESRALLSRVGLDTLNPETLVEDISQHEAQLVEIAKALGNRPCILVMDEPTSALSRNEVSHLFEIIRNLRRQGLAIVYISHHLPEIMQIADRVTVMRDGRKVDTVSIGATTPAKLVEKMMVGRKIGEAQAPRARVAGRPRFRVEGATRYGFFHRVSFALHEGEILGLGGLAGAGRSELARSLCGIDPLDEGRLTIDDRPIAPADMCAAMRCGLAYLSEDRKRDGLALQLTASQNALSALTAKAGRLVRGRRALDTFVRHASELNLYPIEADRQASQFSGGNQQKILLAKWLAAAPEVCILDEPTRGVDVGAKQVIHEAIGRLADAGKCVLLITSDLPELCALAHRVLIMRRGRIVREMKAGEFTEDLVLLAANGEG